MSLKDLSSSERDIAFQCLNFVSSSNYFDGCDFETLLGMTRTELATVISNWPHLNDDDADHLDFMAVNNAFNEVCHGIRFTQEEWQRYFSVAPSAVCEAFYRWLQTERSAISRSE